MQESTKSRSRGKSKTVFTEELNVLNKSKEFLVKEDMTLDECKHQLELLQNHYDELLDQSKLITKVSDRLQKKINKANDELAEKNTTLQETTKQLEEKNTTLQQTTNQLDLKNKELQTTLDNLDKAKIGRKAASITTGVAIALFIIIEGFIEPPIEEYANQFTHFTWLPLILALSAKLAIALFVRPIDRLIEGYLIRKEMRKSNIN